METENKKEVYKVWKITTNDSVLESEHETLSEAGFKLGKLISLGIQSFLTIDKKENNL